MEIFENLGYCSQGNLATPTQLRCDASAGIFSNHFITNFPQNVSIKILKIHEYLATIWTKICVLLFWPNL